MTRGAWIFGLMTMATACGSRSVADERSDEPAPSASIDPAPQSPVSETAATVKITSLTTSSAVVEYGTTATLSWTLEGKPEELMLDGVSVLGESSHLVQPARRQNFHLVAKTGSSRDEKVVEVAARGIDQLIGVVASPGEFDGPPTRASFHGPRAVAAAPDGSLIVADYLGRRIRKVDANGVTTLAAGPAITGPRGVAVGDDGTIYVADYHAVRTLSPDGSLTTIVGDGTLGENDGVGTAAKTTYPSGIVLLPGGEFLLLDRYAVRKVSANRTVTTLFHISGNDDASDSPNATFVVPLAGARDASGNVYIADWCRVRKIDPDSVVTTLAGGPCGEAVDGTRAQAVFGELWGIAVDDAGDVYVSDATARTIRRIRTSADEVVTLAGNSSVMPQFADDSYGRYATFGGPGGLARRSDGSLAIADMAAHRVRALQPNGKVTTIAGQTLSYGWQDGPRGINRTGGFLSFAIEPTGAIAIADAWFNSIRRLAPDGTLTTIAGGSLQAATVDGVGPDARFATPNSIVASGGQLIVPDYSGVLRRVDATGKVDTFAGLPGAFKAVDGPPGVGAFRFIVNVVGDSKGDFFVNEAGAIRIVTPDGSIDTFAGGTVTGQVLDGVGKEARLTAYTRALAIDHDDNLYFADGGWVIRKVTPKGEVTTVAGSFNDPGYKDGPAHEAKFQSPIEGIAVDVQSNLFVSDSGNHVIRKITPQGMVSTVAGTYGVLGLRAGPLPGSLFAPRQLAVTPAGDLVVDCGAGAIQITAP